MTHLHVCRVCPATPLRRSCRRSFLCLCLTKSSVATGCNWQHRNPTFATEDLYPTSGASCVSQGLEVLPCAILRQVSNPNPWLWNDHQHAEPHHPNRTLTAYDRSTSWLAKALHFRINPQNKQETSRRILRSVIQTKPKKGTSCTNWSLQKNNFAKTPRSTTAAPATLAEALWKPHRRCPAPSPAFTVAWSVKAQRSITNHHFQNKERRCRRISHLDPNQTMKKMKESNMNQNPSYCQVSLQIP